MGKKEAKEEKGKKEGWNILYIYSLTWLMKYHSPNSYC